MVGIYGMLLFFTASLEGKKTLQIEGFPWFGVMGHQPSPFSLSSPAGCFLRCWKCVQRWAVELGKVLEHKEKSLENF